MLVNLTDLERMVSLFISILVSIITFSFFYSIIGTDLEINVFTSVLYGEVG